MKTEDLVTMLASGAGAVEPNAAVRRYATAIGWGAFGATLLLAICLGVRPDRGELLKIASCGESLIARTCEQRYFE